MEVLICGTAASEGWPALFCNCPACIEARRRGGKNLRTRAAYQVGERIHIDFGPDSYFHQLKYELANERVEHLLMSHSHWDHWAPLEIGARRPGFSVIPEGAILHIYGNDAVRSKLEEAIGADFERHFLTFHSLKLWEKIPLSDGIVAVPLEAAHDRRELCVNWMLEQDGRRFLQGHDTGWWGDETWEFLRQNPLDVVVMDCTYGSIENRSGHLGCSAVVEAFERLNSSGALKPSCRRIATHFSHNGGWLHEQLEEYFTPHGIEVAFDGMRVEF